MQGHFNFDQQPTGETLRDKGMQRAIDHAVEEVADWKDRAMECLNNYPLNEFMAEDLRSWAYLQGLEQPPSERAWGTIIAKARKDGLIVHIGYKAVTNPKAHKTPASLWLKIK